VFRCLLPLLSAALVLTLGSARGQALLELPYGLKWGDSPEKLIALASQHSLDVNISLPGKQPALRIVRLHSSTGLWPGSTETDLEGRFLGGHLIELTLHYTDPEANANQMEERFEKLKAQMTATHGALINDQRQQSVQDKFATRSQSYHRDPVQGLFLMLMFTEVEDLLRKSKEARYSVMYRNDNLRQEIEKLLAAPPVPRDGR